MRYYKIVSDGYILAVGADADCEEIAEAEYNAILKSIRNCLAPPDGMLYRLRNDMTWELYDAPKGGGL